MDINKIANLKVDTNPNRLLGKKRTLRQEPYKTEFAIDYLQAEFVNLDNDDSNIKNWKKGDKLHQWTRDIYWKVVKVNTSDWITLEKINAGEVEEC